MGQKIGKGYVVEAAEPFLSLPQSAIDELWKSFTLNTEGWGLNPAQFVRMCRVLQATMALDDAAAEKLYTDLFAVFDTDKNDLIDALEFLATIAAVSGMDANKKMMFVFNLYDFSENGELMRDEVTLLMKSTVVGLSKISLATPPTLAEFEALAKLAIGAELSIDGKPVPEGSAKISRTKFVTYCDQNPTMSSWLSHYDDVAVPTDDAPAAPAAIPTLEVPPVDDAAVRYRTGASRKDWPSRTATLADAPCEAAHASLAPAETPPAATTAPDSALALEWVFGCGAPGVRNSVYYTAHGTVAFHAAEVGIVYARGTEEDPKARQAFYQNHGGRVTALALASDGRTVATGEAGPRPAICVWTCDERRTVATLAGFHKDAIASLDFSKDGCLLAAVDAASQMAIWNVATRAKCCSVDLAKEALALAWTTSSLSLVTAGADHVTFWMASAQDAFNFTAKAGLPGAAGKKKRTHTCCVALDAATGAANGEARVVTATGSGELLRWHGRNCFACVEAHDGAITALHFTSGATKVPLLTTAAGDRKVRVWRADTLEVLCQMDLGTLPCVGLPVAVCLHSNGETCLVATSASELYELSALSTAAPVPEGEEGGPPPVGSAVGGGPLVRGPSGSGGLSAMAASPSGAFFATCGEDNAVTLFEVDTKKTLFREVMQSKPTCCAFAPDNSCLLVGLEKGSAVVFSIGDEFLQTKTLTPGAPPEDGAEADPDAPAPPPVVDAKWVEGCIALGAANQVHFFDGAYTFRAVSAELSAAVTRLDLAEGGAPVCQVALEDLDLVILSTEDGSPSAPDAARDVAWHAPAVPLGYGFKCAVASLFFAQVADVSTVAAAPSLGLCAVGDAYGGVDLLPYPCTAPANFAPFPGHGAGGFAGLAFLTGEPVGLLSAGAADGIVAQWTLDHDERVDEADAAEEGEPAAAGDDDEDAPTVVYDPDEDGNLEDGVALDQAADRSVVHRAFRSDNAAALFALEDAAAGEDAEVDAREATAPWRDGVVAPAEAAYEGAAATNDDLELEWVHGYSGSNARNNVFYNSKGDVVYPAACLGVVLDKRTRTQRHCLAHTDVVTATAPHPDGDLCATGQVGEPSHVVVWSTLTGDVKRRWTLNAGCRACSCLAFSPDGRYLACAAQDDDHVVYVYDWADGVLAAHAATGAKKVLAMSFSADSTKLLFGAVDSFGIATLSGRSLSVKKGIYGSAARRQTVFSVAWITDGEGAETAVVGTAGGGVYKLDGRAIGAGEKLHAGPVTAFYACPVLPGAEDGPETSAVCLASGAIDGKVKLLTPDLEVKMEFDLLRPDYECVNGSIASVSINNDRRKVLVGTKGSEILELSTLDESDVNKGALVTGHCRGRLCALACHPILAEFATAGDDATLRLWDVATHAQLRSLKLEEAARAIGFMPNGHLIGVGLGAEEAATSKTGLVLVVSTLKPSLEVVKELKDTVAAISAIQFSPDGECMAAAACDTKIYVYDTLNNFVLKATCGGHSEVPRTMDWSTDSVHLQSCSSGPSFECVIHDAKQGETTGDGAERLCNEAWESWTATIGWGVTGAYPDHAAPADVTATARSFDRDLLATADDYGGVKIYRWPCVRPGAPAKVYAGHGARVSAVRFTPDSAYLASAGDGDRCVFQWARKKNGDGGRADVADAAALALAADVAPPALPPVPEVEATGWKDDVAPPTEDVMGVEPPSAAPELEFAYGVPTRRGSIGYNANGDVVYAASRLCVVYEKKAHAQKFYAGCAAPVSAFCVSSDGRLAAAAEIAADCVLRVFEATTACEVAVLDARLRGAATHAAFSADGKTLAACGAGLGGYATLATWTSPTGGWRDGRHACSAVFPLETVGFLAFAGEGNGAFDACAGGRGEAVGTPDVTFWKFRGRNVVARQTVTPAAGLAAFSAGVCVGARLLAGTVDGALTRWEQKSTAHAGLVNETARETAAHAGAVACAAYAAGDRCVTGGVDGWVKVWNTVDLEVVSSFFLGEAPVRAVAVDRKFLRVVATTAAATMVEIVTDSGAILTLLEGEAAGARGLAVNGDAMAVSGDAGVVSLWSLDRRRKLAAFDVGFAARAAAFSPNGTHLCVGLGSGAPARDVDGKFMILDVVRSEDGATAELLKINEGHNAKGHATCAAYSPDGSVLALGCADSIVYLYTVAGMTPYELFAVFDKHEAPIENLDFSDDNKYLRATAANRALLACSCLSGEEVPLNTLNDTVWATDTCTLGYEKLNLWIDDAPADPAVATNRKNDTLVSCAHSGAMTLQAFPAIDADAESVVVNAHGGPVSRIEWPSDDVLVTAGAHDSLVLQWRPTQAKKVEIPIPVDEEEEEEDAAPAEA